MARGAIQIDAGGAEQHCYDRMLVAQAKAEGLILVTHDRLLAPYDVEILWA